MSTTNERYHAAADRMDSLIEMSPTPEDSSREAVQERARFRMGRLLRFLERLGNPQAGYPIVHIGGTSGKGSTSTMVTAILTAAGYRAGLHTSPYLQTPLEKLQIGGRLCSAERFIEIVDHFFGEHDRWVADGEEPLTYGEGWNALTWLFFRAERVDVAVVEVGAGGRFDLTNICSPTLSIITSVGIDHTNTLGSTIADIAWHKAGIIKVGIPALSAVPDVEAQAIIREESDQVGAPLVQLHLDTEVTRIRTSPTETIWQEVDSGAEHRTRMSGSFQARNGQTAVRAARMLRDSGFAISDREIDDGLRLAQIPGRAETVTDRVPVLLDGAHNAEKVAAFASDIPSLLPVNGGRRIGVVGLLSAKKGDDMIRSLTGVMDLLVATSPRVLGKEARDSEAIRTMALSAGFDGDVIVEPQPEEAIQRALAMAAYGDAVFVAGSLYLVGNIRERWYPEEAIVRERTPWPGEA